LRPGSKRVRVCRCVANVEEAGAMSFWRIVFALAAVFNLAIGVSLAAAPDMIYAQGGQEPAADYFYARTAGLLIAVFGIGYAMVAVQPARNRAIVWLGVIGKACMPVLSWSYVQAGLVGITSFYLSLGDLMFVILFAVFLWRTKPA
jgi:hypothetical protein